MRQHWGIEGEFIRRVLKWTGTKRGGPFVLVLLPYVASMGLGEDSPSIDESIIVCVAKRHQRSGRADNYLPYIKRLQKFVDDECQDHFSRV